MNEIGVMVTLQKGPTFDFEILHTEVMYIPESYFIFIRDDESMRWLSELLLLKGSYIKEQLIPYFDLLYDYEYLEVGKPREFDRVMNCRHKRSTLLSREYSP